MPKYAARLAAGETTLPVLIPALLVPGEVLVTIDGTPEVAFTVSGPAIVLDTPLAAEATVQVTFGEA